MKIMGAILCLIEDLGAVVRHRWQSNYLLLSLSNKICIIKDFYPSYFLCVVIIWVLWITISWLLGNSNPDSAEQSHVFEPKSTKNLEQAEAWQDEDWMVLHFICGVLCNKRISKSKWGVLRGKSFVKEGGFESYLEGLQSLWRRV